MTFSAEATTALHRPVAAALDASGDRWRFAGCIIELHPSEAEGFYLNVSSPDPKVFVMWRQSAETTPPVELVRVTVSYNEAARSLDGGEAVDPAPMPPGLRAIVEEYTALNYRQEKRQKVRRNDPQSDGLFRRERATRR